MSINDSQRSMFSLDGSRIDTAPKLLSIVFICVLFFSLFSLGGDGSAQIDGGSSVVRQLSWIFIAIIIFGSCFNVGRFFTVELSINPLIVMIFVFLLYCIASSFWSSIPLVTLKRSLLFSIMVLLCFFTFCPKREFQGDYLSVLAVPIGLLILFSYIFTVISPASAITSVGWRGVTSFKNEFGQLCAVGVLVFSFGFFKFKYKSIGTFLLFLSIVGLFLSRSSTCILAVLIGFSLSFLFLIIKKSRFGTVISFALIFSLIALSFIVLSCFVFGFITDIHGLVSNIFGLLGKSTNLTGRTSLWLLIDDNFRLHSKWIGSGYGGFWDGLGSPAGFTSYRFPGGYVGQAHNGYLDVLNDLGYLGVGFLMLILLCWLIYIGLVDWMDGYEGYFHFGFFIYIVIMNFAESTFFRLVVFLNIVLFSSIARVIYRFTRTVK